MSNCGCDFIIDFEEVEEFVTDLEVGIPGPKGDDGVSPTVTITEITDGHRVTITDKDHPSGQSFDVMNGEDGASDAGAVTYDETETYDDGTVGYALNDLKQQTSDIEDATEAALDTKAPVILETASGAIASFDDGADSMPIRKLVAQIEPVQDLHGYSNPWPAGGGKNKFHNTGVTTTSNGVTFTVNADGTVSCSGTATGTAVYRVNLSYSDLPQGESLILNGCPAGGGFTSSYGAALCSSSGSALGNSTDSGAGKTYTVDELANLAQYQIVVRSGINANGLVFKPMIRLATETDATFAPYENICPISGHTGAEVKQRGKNLVELTRSVDGTNVAATRMTNVTVADQTLTFTAEGDNPFFGSVVAANNQYTKSVGPLVKLKKNTDYYVRVTNLEMNQLIRTMYDKDKKSLGFMYIPGGTGAFNSGDAEYVSFRIGKTNAVSGVTYSTGIMLEFGTTASDYVKYQEGSSLSVTFPSEAGTVYGGEDEVISGKLTNRTKKVAVNNMTWARSDGGIFYSRLIDKENINANKIWCDTFKVHEGNASNLAQAGLKLSNFECIASAGSQSPYIYVLVSGETTSTFLQKYGDAEFIYELAEPTEYTLTPQTVETLYGTNNVWVDTGDVTVEYPADTKLYIEQLTKPTEDDMTADHAIASGTFFMIGNTLYLATSQIAAGGTITPGTNATQLSLADALNQLNA